MSTIFIALQCFQCSTMQVKQQKKSSNKWVCVICNEKQSVQRIFARGYLAKDVRKFVQTFNSSRQFESEALSILSLTPQNQEIPTEEFAQTRRRNDWSEYLDPSKEEEGGGGGGGEGFVLEDEVEIVTEFPKELFEKKGRDGRKQLLKPVFSKRKERPRNPHGDGESEECQRKKARQVSKWNGYLEEENDGLIELEREPPKHYNSWTGGAVSESHYNDQMVEEDIHPDFT